MLPKEVTAGKRPYSEYFHIYLTEEEKEDALNYKRMLKQRFMEQEEKRDKKNNLIKEYQRPWSYEELRQEVMERTKQLPFEFVVDEYNERIIHLLCLYFSGDERFNNEEIEFRTGDKRKLSLKKGIGLVSECKGTGKSILMTLFQQNKNRPFFSMETKNVSAAYNTHGEEVIKNHSELMYVPPTPTFFFYERIGLCFDDLGFEVPKNSWGNKSDVMADVLFSIYSKLQMRGDFSFFHFTSNMGGAGLEERYGDRVKDRLREMFNMIPVPGQSRRK